MDGDSTEAPSRWVEAQETLKAWWQRLWNGEGPRPPWLRRIALVVFAFLVPIPIVLILLFRFVPVPFAPEMLVPLAAGEGLHYHWVSRGEMAPALSLAVIASEDDAFCSHHGFDWKDIDTALKAHSRGKRLRGASTISQQTARSLFLLPVRSWVRKGVEAWLTVLLEALWPKERILTAYLNLVDWGHGNFGADAAAESYFHKHAAALTAREAARLAVILPDPGVWKAAHPGPYVAERSGVILARMREVREDGLDSCVRPRG